MKNVTIKIEIDLWQGITSLRKALSKFDIGHLLLLSSVLHLFVISFPQDGFIFDEAHYVPAALQTSQLQAANIEQMPLAKIVVALSMGLFGNYWFAWRFPIVVMGVISLYVFYKIALKFLTVKQALFATSFLLFDIIYFVHSTIFVLDVPAILFGLMGVNFYLSKNYKLSALSLGVSCLMKISGFMFFMTIAIFHVATKLKKANLKKSNLRKDSVIMLMAFMLVFAMAGGGGLWLYDLVYKPTKTSSVYTIVQNNVIVDQNGVPITTQTIISNVTSAIYIANPFDHLMFSIGYFESLVPNIQTQERDLRPPLSWILPLPSINPFNSPVYFAINVNYGYVTKTTVEWVSQNSLPIAYMLIPILILVLINLLKSKERTKEHFAILYISWVASTYVPWLYIGTVQRVTFNYYFIFTIPMLCLGIPYFWSRLPLAEKYKNWGMFVHLMLTVVFFFYFFPILIFR